MNFPLLHRECTAPEVGHTDSQTAVLETAGDSGIRARLIDLPDGFETFRDAAAGIDDLAIRKHIARPDHVKVSELPGIHATFFGQQIEITFHGITALCHAKTPEGTGNDIVGINSLAHHINILEVIRSGRVGTGPLSDRSPQGSVSARIGYDLGNQGCNASPGVTGGSHLHGHGMPLGVDDRTLIT